MAWDGEGYTTARGRHRYWLLGNSTGALLERRGGLRTLDALPWIATHLADVPALHVAFSFGYDVNMLLRDVPRATLARVHAGEYVRIGRCALQWQPRKRLTLHVHQYDADREVWTRRGGHIWDVFGFFQSSFVAALQQYGVLPADVLQDMADMKAARRTFDWEMRDAVRAYMTTELDALVALMGRVRDAVREAGLTLARWDGAGAVAAALLQREGVKPHKGRSPARVETLARHAYFGGRIEAVRYGHTDQPCYRYDVRSAYPHALAQVPSLAGAVWEERPPGVGESFALARVRWAFAPREGAVYPFPWRAPNGRIYFPPNGEGVVWYPEVDAARSQLAAGVIAGRVEVLEAWTCVPATDVRPFGFVPELFRQRAQWKREGRGAEKILKLGLNSLYGKTAQHVGGSRGAPPAWHQLEWAGYVTSATRARLVTASLPAQAKGALVMFATDAIFSLQPLALPNGGLGTFEGDQLDGITVVQSGVYWVGPLARGTAYYRGFDADSLSRRGVLNGWRRGRGYVCGVSRRFVGMGRALASRTLEQWGQWPRTVRRLQLHPLVAHHGKRHVLQARRDVGTLWPTWATDPHIERIKGGAMSQPIALPWSVDGVPVRRDAEERVDPE